MFAAVFRGGVCGLRYSSIRGIRLFPALMAESTVLDGWREKWDQSATGWHRDSVDTRLKQYLDKLTQGKPSVSILVTWCGKSVDIPWLCEQGYSVVGVEISEIAVKQLFEENGIPYDTSQEGEFKVHKASDKPLKIITGNYYNLTPEVCGTFEAVWDHNAFCAAQPSNRELYIKVLVSLLKPNARILLSTWEYDQSKRSKAPFSVPTELVNTLFKEQFNVEYLDSTYDFTPYFMKKFDLEWANALIHLLSLKSV